MGRTRLEMPENYAFSTELTLRISDINYGGHLGNDSLLSIIHEARLRFLKNYGYSELDLEGVSMIMADSVIIYKSEGFYAETLKIHVTAADFSHFGFDVLYKLENVDSGKDLAHAKTSMICFDYTERAKKPVPEKFKNLFS